jgi:hypothetical protein
VRAGVFGFAERLAPPKRVALRCEVCVEDRRVLGKQVRCGASYTDTANPALEGKLWLAVPGIGMPPEDNIEKHKSNDDKGNANEAAANKIMDV